MFLISTIFEPQILHLHIVATSGNLDVLCLRLNKPHVTDMRDIVWSSGLWGNGQVDHFIHAVK